MRDVHRHEEGSPQPPALQPEELHEALRVALGFPPRGVLPAAFQPRPRIPEPGPCLPGGRVGRGGGSHWLTAVPAARRAEGLRAPGCGRLRGRTRRRCGRYRSLPAGISCPRRKRVPRIKGGPIPIPARCSSAQPAVPFYEGKGK